MRRRQLHWLSGWCFMVLKLTTVPKTHQHSVFHDFSLDSSSSLQKGCPQDMAKTYDGAQRPTVALGSAHFQFSLRAKAAHLRHRRAAPDLKRIS